MFQKTLIAKTNRRKSEGYTQKIVSVIVFSKLANPR